jgi:hypothetical protein
MLIGELEREGAYLEKTAGNRGCGKRCNSDRREQTKKGDMSPEKGFGRHVSAVLTGFVLGT